MTSRGDGRSVRFRIVFHTPFRVGASSSRDGVDAAADHVDPLPADHLKGVMRATARNLLRLVHSGSQVEGNRAGPAETLVEEVFGSTSRPCPWSWTSAAPQAGQEWVFTERHRVSIDPNTHSALKDHLVLGEQVWAPSAGFDVSRIEWLEPDELALHRDVLLLAGTGLHALGGWSRRGLGWVGVSAVDGRVVDAGVISRLRAGLLRDEVPDRSGFLSPPPEGAR